MTRVHRSKPPALGSFPSMDTVNDKECDNLAGLFQQIAKDAKHGLPLFDELAQKTTRLQGTIKATMFALSTFLDTFQKIADNASNTKGSSRDIGICLTRIVLRHRALESQMKTYSNSLVNSLVSPIQSKSEEWKKTVSSMDKEHAKEYKQARKSIKKKTEYITKMKKKGKKSPSPQLSKLVEQAEQDLHIKYKILEEQEQQSVRRINTQERTHYCTLAGCIKTVIAEEYNMLGELHKLDEVMDKLETVTADPHNVTDTADQVIRDMKNAAETFSFKTPPSTPGGSMMGSRRGSVSSFSSSRASSTASLHDRDTTQDQPQRRKHTDNYKRYSSVSCQSQNSGFTTPDIYCQRPNSSLSKNSVETRGRSTSRQRGEQPPVFSTVRRAHSPYRPPPDCVKVTRRPPLPHHIKMAVTDKQFNNSNETKAEAVSQQTGPTQQKSPSPAEGQGMAEGIPISAQLKNLGNFGSIFNPYKSPSRSPTQSNEFKFDPIYFPSTKLDQPIYQSTNLNQLIHSNNNLPQPTPTDNQTHQTSPCDNSSYNQIYQRISAALNNPTTPSSHRPTMSHYAVPRSNLKIQSVPDFNPRRPTVLMSSPLPVYTNTDEVNTALAELEDIISSGDDEIMTPTTDEMSLPDGKIEEDSTGSIGSSLSSGYGSQLTVLRVEEQNPPTVFPTRDITKRAAFPKFTTFSKGTNVPTRSISFSQADTNPQSAGTTIAIRRRSSGFGSKPSTPVPLPPLDQDSSHSSFLPPLLLSLQDPERGDADNQDYSGKQIDPTPGERSPTDPEANMSITPAASTLRRSLSIGVSGPSKIDRQDPRYRSVKPVSQSDRREPRYRSVNTVCQSDRQKETDSAASQSASLIRALNERLKTQIPRPISKPVARPSQSRVSGVSGLPKFSLGHRQTSFRQEVNRK